MSHHALLAASWDCCTETCTCVIDEEEMSCSKTRPIAKNSSFDILISNQEVHFQVQIGVY